MYEVQVFQGRIALFIRPSDIARKKKPISLSSLKEQMKRPSLKTAPQENVNNVNSRGFENILNDHVLFFFFVAGPSTCLNHVKRIHGKSNPICTHHHHSKSEVAKNHQEVQFILLTTSQNKLQLIFCVFLHNGSKGKICCSAVKLLCQGIVFCL